MEYVCYQSEEYVFSVFNADYGPFGVRIKSDTFSGSYVFCVERENLEHDIIKLKELINTLEGIYRLNDMDSDSYIIFEMMKYGKLAIRGMIGGSYSDNYMVFGFEADQTLLTNFIESLTKIIYAK